MPAPALLDARPASDAHPIWPLFDLRITTPRLELRLPTDADIAALAAVARTGVHADDAQPFRRSWTQLPSPRFERSFAQYFWSLRAEWSPERWRLPLAAFDLDGQPVGVQQIGSHDFAIHRTVRSATWVARALQGRGLGTEMRRAALTLAFDHLDARVAEAGTNADNVAARRMLEKLGYRATETVLEEAGDAAGPRPVVQYRLDAGAWRRQRSHLVLVDGLDVAVFALDTEDRSTSLLG